MKKAISLLVFMFACSSEPMIDITDQGLICGLYCDPSSIQNAATQYGESLFFDSVLTGQWGCGTTSQGDTVCSSGFQTCELSCGGDFQCCQYIAYCTATQCDWYR
jgi:hypothetical protein